MVVEEVCSKLYRARNGLSFLSCVRAEIRLNFCASGLGQVLRCFFFGGLPSGSVLQVISTKASLVSKGADPKKKRLYILISISKYRGV